MNKLQRLELISNILILIAFGLSLVLGAFTIMYMFNNFVSNVFSIQTINMPQAFGIDLLISYVIYRGGKNKNQKSFEIVTTSIVSSSLFLLISKLLIVFFF